MMNESTFDKGKIVSFEQVRSFLPGSKVEDLDAVYCCEDPEAICIKVVTASGEEKYLQIGSDNDGFTDLSDERLEENRFYIMLLSASDQVKALTLEELKQLRMDFAKEAMKYKKHEAMIRNDEMKIFNTAPMADAYRFYFKVHMTIANVLNEVINEREESNNGKV